MDLQKTDSDMQTDLQQTDSEMQTDLQRTDSDMQTDSVAMVKQADSIIQTIYSTELVFYVNGKRICESNAEPEMTLLTYLREKLSLKGAKAGCEGADVVMISRWCKRKEKIRNYAACASLIPVVSLHGKAVTTVEGVGTLTTQLHDIQERLCKLSGEQLGFSTPGVVMSMYTLLKNKRVPIIEDIEEAMQGNVSRAAGYRAIIRALRTYTSSSTERITAYPFYDASPQELVFPPRLLIDSKSGVYDSKATFRGDRCTWYRPNDLKELLQIRRKHPNAKLVCGNTELGVYAEVKGQHHKRLVSTRNIDELNKLNILPPDDVYKYGGVELGASCSLSEVEEYLKEIVEEKEVEDEEEKHKFQVFSTILDMIRWFASKPVRNMASIGGNLMHASPSSDLNPIWLTNKAHAEYAQLTSSDDEVVYGCIPVDKNFFTGHLQTALPKDAVLVSIFIPLNGKYSFTRAYKVSKRRESDYAIVCASMCVEFYPGASVVKRFRMAYGGLADRTVMPAQSCANRDWNDKRLVDDMCNWLRSSLPLSIQAPGGKAAYRETLAASLFLKFYLDVRAELYSRGMSRLKAPPSELSCLTTLHNPWRDMKSSQTYPPTPPSQLYIDQVGRPVRDVMCELYVSGGAEFVSDIPVQRGELHCSLLLSTRQHASLVEVDLGQAHKHPAFVSYVDHTDVKGSNRYGIDDCQRVFADKEVTRVGQIIGAVIGLSEHGARQAAALVKITYEDLESGIITIEDAIEKKTWYDVLHVKKGKAEEEYRNSDVLIEGQIRIGAQEHYNVETNCCIVVPQGDGGLEVFSSTQDPTYLQSTVSKVVGVANHKVVARVKLVGGHAGGKDTNPLRICNPVAVAAQKLGRSVRCVLARHEDMLVMGKSHPFLAKYKVATDKSCCIRAAIIELYCNAGNSVDRSREVLEKSMFSIDNGYNFPNITVTGRLCKTNVASNCSSKGFGVPQISLISEDIIDKIALKMNKTHAKVREANMYRKEGEQSFYGMEVEGGKLRKCYNKCYSISEYDSRRLHVDDFNRCNVHRKRGLSLNIAKYGTGFARSKLNQASAVVRIYKDSSVLVSHGGVETGQAITTKLIQVAGHELGVKIERIRVNETNTSVIGNCPPTSGSISIELNARAVQMACAKLNARLRVYKEKNPEVEWEKVIKQAFRDRVNLSATGHYSSSCEAWKWDSKSGEVGETSAVAPWRYFTYGCCVSEVEVDCLTGEHVVLSSHLVLDAGVSLNPAVDVARIESGFMQGYGLFCLEEPLHSSDGDLITVRHGKYKIPGFGQLPRNFHLHLIDNSPNPQGVCLSKGVEEVPVALASSVFFAIKDAIRAHRRKANLPTDFPLNSPATVEATRMAVGDRFTLQHHTHTPPRKEVGIKPWSVQA